MSIYSPRLKAMYLSPNRLELLHRRRDLASKQTTDMRQAHQHRSQLDSGASLPTGSDVERTTLCARRHFGRAALELGSKSCFACSSISLTFVAASI